MSRLALDVDPELAQVEDRCSGPAFRNVTRGRSASARLSDLDRELGRVGNAGVRELSCVLALLQRPRPIVRFFRIRK
jgi:hypothetical protein